MLHEVFIVASNPYVLLEVLELLSFSPHLVSSLKTSKVLYHYFLEVLIWMPFDIWFKKNVIQILWVLVYWIWIWLWIFVVFFPVMYFHLQHFFTDLISVSHVPYGLVCCCSSFFRSVPCFSVHWRLRVLWWLDAIRFSVQITFVLFSIMSSASLDADLLMILARVVFSCLFGLVICSTQIWCSLGFCFISLL